MPAKVKNKPKKPYPEFPLTPHSSGNWCKKIRGKIHYFGRDWRAALNKYQEARDDLQAGRTPGYNRKGCTVADMVNGMLTEKQHRVRSGELSDRTFDGYRRTGVTLAEVLGRNRPLTALTPEEFRELRVRLSESRGHVALRNELVRARSFFKWAWMNGKIEQPMKFGTAFDLPTKQTLRVSRQKQRQKQGKNSYEATEIRSLADAAGIHLHAMILLGINCGFGNTDCASLPRSVVDLKSGWLDFPRPTTGAERRCPLWPETVSALERSLEKRPPAKSDEDEPLVFITKYGHRWMRAGETGQHINGIGQQFAKLQTAVGTKRTGRGFYGLRHTFETVGGAARDQVAVNLIMGHVDASMAEVYREEVGNDRLIAVTDHVRAWLFE